ncbi:MAG: trypsin-like cysteine/serine peptidase domain-containing protein [Monoraphidium minutum]|nr:MAG: trypsin-like cysteine/serine peptidase domain-containing protein [Monoraphidium minutum]
MPPPRARMGLAACLLAFIVTASPALAAGGAKRSAVPAPAQAVDCSTGCTFHTRPVCGVDGEWYQNECIAVCSGLVSVAPDLALCKGKSPPFMDMHPGPAGAESAGGNNTVPGSVVTAFLEEGFRYLGRIRLAHEAGPRPEPAGEQPAPERDEKGAWRVKAVRCTAEGDMYIGSMRIPTKPFKLDGYIPPWMSHARPLAAFEGNSTLMDFAASIGLGRNASARHGGAAGLLLPKLKGRRERSRFENLLADFMSWFSAAPAAAPAHQRAAGAAADSDADEVDASGGTQRRRLAAAGRGLKELVGGDDRQGCQRGFPYTAIGQIQVVDGTGLYICTGTLIAPDKVLTAGHCVWNIKRGAFYYNLNYAPGRYREGGRVVNPWGVVPWKSVTVFDSFKKNPSTWDVAVVTLTKPLGSLTGYMGIASGCGRHLQLTTAGYPQDKSQGTCMAASCAQRALDCDTPTNPHVCDTYMGMSGSPLWDGKNRVRLIHVAGVEGRAQNRATTLTQFLVNTISRW